MVNFFESILQKSDRFKLLRSGDSMATLYNCQLENKFADMWSHTNYIVYVTEGKKTWHTPHGSYELQKGDCVFVRKGACIIEQFFDASFCLVLFFVPDEFIGDTLKTKSNPISVQEKKFDPVIPIAKSERLESFFNSMEAYFEGTKDPDRSLLELKFRELILIMADDQHNRELLSYFHSILLEPQSAVLQKIMEDNYCYNLKLDEYARLSNRSLSAFKRDFQKQFDQTPGKWLLEKRLGHSMYLLKNTNKTVAESAFESGFENSSHFSRSFKTRFGVAPANIKQGKDVLRINKL